MIVLCLVCSYAGFEQANTPFCPYCVQHQIIFNS